MAVNSQPLDYERLLSRRVQEIKPSGIRKFFDIANEMEDVVALGVGEPDFKTPWVVRDAAIQTLERGRTSYSANAGLARLREELGLSFEIEMDGSCADGNFQALRRAGTDVFVVGAAALFGRDPELERAYDQMERAFLGPPEL